MESAEMDAEAYYAERALQLGFRPQKEIVYNKLLPYADRLDEESNRYLRQIKDNLARSVMLRESKPSSTLWCSRLNKYIRTYGLKFSKEDHIAFIKLIYELITIPNLEFTKLDCYSVTLIILLKKRECLSPNDIQLAWRPLYEVCKYVVENELSLSPYKPVVSLRANLRSLARAAKLYFPVSGTQEMLDEWRPLLCPFSLNELAKTFSYLEWFLPVYVKPCDASLGYELWLKEFMTFWEVCHNAAGWESDLMNLMASVASMNIGYIDWEPYVPFMFTRFLNSLDLPVYYKQHKSGKHQKISVSTISLWIVSAMGGPNNTVLFYLEKFFRTLESFYYPANIGRWVLKLKDLLWRLPSCFVHRLNKERFMKPTWETPIPASHHLTDEDIDRFIAVMRPIVTHAMFAKQSSVEISHALLHLSLLRPAIVVPWVLDKMYLSMDTLTEPHKYTASMQSVIAVTRAMVQGGQLGYPEGPSHVIPLLLAFLPGIDTNDIRKLLLTVQFISAVVSMVPLVDSSTASEHWADMTPEEVEIAEATSGLEDFVLQFLDKLFVLIESSSLESTRLEQADMEKRSALESAVGQAVSSSALVILTQCSVQIFDSALRKFYSFVTTHVLETCVSGKMVAALCKSFVLVNGEKTLSLLVPYLCDRLDRMISEFEDIAKEEKLDSEFLYTLLMLQPLAESSGRPLLAHIDRMCGILDQTLHLACLQGSQMANTMLANIMNCLTIPILSDYRTFNINATIQEYLPIRDWGKVSSPRKVKHEWYVPSATEIDQAQKLLNKYLPPEIERLEKYIRGELALTRDQLQCSLRVICAVLACESVLPTWDEEPLKLNRSKLEPLHFDLHFGQEHFVTMPDGRNVRKVVADLMHSLQAKLLQSAEDDVKSFYKIIYVYEVLVMRKFRLREFDTHWKAFYVLKKLMEDRYRGGKKHLHIVLADRTMLQHEYRMENCEVPFTETHRQIMHDLYSLSVSHYSGVRMRAQRKLHNMVSNYPFSYTVLMETLAKSLQVDTMQNHEEFKGCLYVLLGPRMRPILTRHDWGVVANIWPLLVRSMPSEKPSIVNLMMNVIETIFKFFPTIGLDVQVPDRCIEAARVLYKYMPLVEAVPPNPAEILEGQNDLNEFCKQSRVQYLGCVEALLNLAINRNLHWIYHTMAVHFLRDLVHPDVAFNASTIKYFLQLLIHESIILRKTAVRVVLIILKQMKKKKKKIFVDPYMFGGKGRSPEICPGYREDNEWVQYRLDSVPRTEEAWNEKRYLHKMYNGYYCWPEKIEMYAPQDQQAVFSVDDLSAEQKEIYEFFLCKENVDTLIKYWTIEDKKGKDKFSLHVFMLFKGIFRNFEDALLPMFLPHLERLVGNKQEECQRCAAELLAGLMRGSKHWPFAKVSAMWRVLDPLIRRALGSMTTETVSDWCVCFATSCDVRDPNRHHFLYEILMDEPLRDEASFIDCGRLHALQSAMVQQSWRVGELSHRLLAYLKDFLTHPYQNVRDRISSVLTNTFQLDIQFPNGLPAKTPHVEDFMAELMPKLQVLYAADIKDVNHVNNHRLYDVGGASVAMENIRLSDDEKDVALRLFKTVGQWVSASLCRGNHSAVPFFYRIFPLTCLLQSYQQDVSTICTHIIAGLAATVTLEAHIPAALAAIQEASCSASWSARAACTEFIQVFVFHNMSTVLSRAEWVDEVTGMVLRLLEDAQLEVRVQASLVLGGLFHCQFVPSPESRLNEFKLKAKIKLKGVKEQSDALRQRHAGVLGLCSFISSFPYDVPDFLPDIIFELGAHLNDPHPIPTAIRKTLSDFKRTHLDNWEVHKLKFTADQLSVLSDLTIPPSYYA